MEQVDKHMLICALATLQERQKKRLDACPVSNYLDKLARLRRWCDEVPDNLQQCIQSLDVVEVMVCDFSEGLVDGQQQGVISVFRVELEDNLHLIVSASQ